ncbi:MAG TPA: hypothetical protein VLA45_19075 [Paracoccaceae bacterium]|nr:hypothetical protein [Paracoccaceae bacterium]
MLHERHKRHQAVVRWHDNGTPFAGQGIEPERAAAPAARLAIIPRG